MSLLVDQLTPAMIRLMSPVDQQKYSRLVKMPVPETLLGRQQAQPAKTTITIPPGQTTDEGRLNNTEKAFLLYLKSQGHEWIGIQDMTFKMADDRRFTPDFNIVVNGRLWCYDVKGYAKNLGKPLIRDDAKFKIGVAAREFRHFADFFYAWRVNGQWIEQQVKP